MFELSLPEIEFDPTALGIAVLVMALVLGSMFGAIPSFGDWDKVPLFTKIGFAVLTGPVMYFIVYKMTN